MARADAATKRRRLGRVVCVLLALPLVAGLSVAGAQGQRATPAERIVSLVPSATEVLFALGAGEHVVGVSSFDTWPPEVLALPKLGGLLDPDEERVFHMQPDVVILDAGQPGLARKLESAGIASYLFAHADLDTALRSMREIGEAVGMSAAGAALASRVRDELDTLRRAHSGAPVRAMVVFGRSPGSFQSLWVIGGAGFTSELLEIAGGENVFGDVRLKSFKVGLEAVLARAPGVVIEARPARGRVVDADALAAEWRSLPGFGRIHVAVVTDDSVLVPGPRMPRAVRLLAAELQAGGR